MTPRNARQSAREAVLCTDIIGVHTPQDTKQRVANLVVETLIDLGVNTFYGIPGGAIASTYDALLDYPTLKVINTRHETGAIFMAMGQARVGGSLPCVLMTSGPGITNAITGLAAAYADGIPLIAIGGEVPRKNYGRGALQEGSRYSLDVLGMVERVTRFSAEATRADAVSMLVQNAVDAALSGRKGPAFISLPIDVASEWTSRAKSAMSVATRFEVDQKAIAAVAAALQEATRGLIVVGSGARHPESVRLIRTLATMLQMPVVTSPKAKGLFPESDPLSLGVFGIGGHPSATAYLEGGVDTVLCIGSGLGEVSTNSWSTLLQASECFIQIDIDAQQIGKNYRVDYGLVGPAHTILRELIGRIAHRRTIGAAGGIKYYEPGAAFSDVVPLKPSFVLNELQRMLPDDTIWTSDIGEHSLFATHYLRVNNPDGFLFSTGLGSMGSGIGAAVGAKIALPERAVVAVCGDFGFQMTGMELATCVNYGIGVVFAIFNDARMRMVESGLNHIFGRNGCMHSQPIDFAVVARAFGARGFNIRTPEDFRRLPEDLARSKIPTVLDIALDPASSFPVNGRVAQIRNFSTQ